MGTRNRKIRSEFVALSIVIAIIFFALIAQWWKDHAVIGWSIVGILVIAFIYTLVRYPPFLNRLTQTLKKSGEKIIYEEKTSSREPLSDNLRAEVYKRALNRCENPFCGFRGNIHIHHIDMNNSNNRLFNLIALCPNCHMEAHSGKFIPSQLHNWMNTDYKRLLERRKHQ